MKTAYIDFDGTLTLVYLRYAHILASFLECAQADMAAYIPLKKARVRDEEIALKLYAKRIDDIQAYLHYKRERLEASCMLCLDECVPGAVQALQTLQGCGFTLHLLSQRRNDARLRAQVEAMGMRAYFAGVTTLAPEKGSQAKAAWLRTIGPQARDVVIGDSPTDIMCAKENGIRLYFVETGLWSAEAANAQEYAVEDMGAEAKAIEREEMCSSSI